MLWTSFIILLGTWCAGSRSQPVVTQVSSMSTHLGRTVKLSCSMNGAQVQNYWQSWYQQKPGSPPRYLVTYYSSPSTGSGDLSQFSSSKEGSQNTWYLTISNVQPKDEADYYCGVWYSSQYIFGGGTQLTVTGQPAAPPTVNLFPPSSDELTSKSKGTLVCLVDDFTPGAIDVTWLADGSPITSNVETTRPTKRNDKYVASSYLSLTAAEYEKKSEYTCKVTHDGKSYQKSVQREACSA